MSQSQPLVLQRPSATMRTCSTGRWPQYSHASPPLPPSAVLYSEHSQLLHLPRWIPWMSFMTPHNSLFSRATSPLSPGLAQIGTQLERNPKDAYASIDEKSPYSTPAWEMSLLSFLFWVVFCFAFGCLLAAWWQGERRPDNLRYTPGSPCMDYD